MKFQNVRSFWFYVLNFKIAFIAFLFLIFILLDPNTWPIFSIIFLVYILWNIVDLIITYTEVELEEKGLVISRRMFYKKIEKVRYQDVLEIFEKRWDYYGRGFPQYNSLKFILRSQKRKDWGKIKIYRGFPDIFKYEEFEKELQKRTNHKIARAPEKILPW